MIATVHTLCKPLSIGIGEARLSERSLSVGAALHRVITSLYNLVLDRLARLFLCAPTRDDVDSHA